MKRYICMFVKLRILGSKNWIQKGFIFRVNVCMMSDSTTSKTDFKPSDDDSCSNQMSGEKETDQTQTVSIPSTSKSGISLENLSGKARRALIRKEKYKELKRKNKGLTNNPNPGYNIFNETEYYFENGLRKVYPYFYVFSTFVKGRWFNRTLCDIFMNEFTLAKEYDVETLVKEGHITVNGKAVPLEYKIKQGDVIENNIHRHENPVSGETIEVIEDNKDVVVVNKPSSIPCHPCGNYRYNSMVFILGKELGYGNLRTVYRLDRLTSGVLIFTKNEASTRKYIDDITNRNVEKEYVCRVEGEFPEGEVVCEQPIAKVSFKMGIMKCGADGKPSKTTFTRLSYNGKTSVVKCKPYTGRTHQIRVHLQYLGHPIVNDACYNSTCFGPEKGKGGNYQLTDTQIRELKEDEHNREMWTSTGENPDFLKRITELKEEQKNPGDQGANSEPTPKKSKLNSCEKSDSNSEDKKLSDPSASVFKTDGDQRLKMDGKPQPPFEWDKWLPSESCPLCKKKFLDPTPDQLTLYLHALSYKGPDWYYETSMPPWAEPNWEEGT
ncbi:pseudouridylate synthase RPUSD2-like [Saccostrea cucullata]|uniref:pseudouridylate synthase RPUSD2-like n=1 Tax=Saccostrea cuccullata TaxID=36930 RepID=UPI002ED60F7D